MQVNIPESITPTVVVTGGAGGIGRAIARRVIHDGERVVVVDLRQDDVDRAVAELGPSATGLACDVTDVTKVRDTARIVAQDLGGTRAVVAAAGWAARSDFLDAPLEQHAQVLAVNLAGILNVTHAFAPDLLSGRANPRLVYVSSDAARTGVRDLATYSAAKAGVNGFARSFALEVSRRGLTVNVVSAGSTDSPMLTDAYTEDEIDKRKRANPIGRLASPDDIAAGVAYFLRADSSYVTGQVLSINGGALRPA